MAGRHCKTWYVVSFFLSFLPFFLFIKVGRKGVPKGNLFFFCFVGLVRVRRGDCRKERKLSLKNRDPVQTHIETSKEEYVSQGDPERWSGTVDGPAKVRRPARVGPEIHPGVVLLVSRSKGITCEVVDESLIVGLERDFPLTDTRP